MPRRKCPGAERQQHWWWREGSRPLIVRCRRVGHIGRGHHRRRGGGRHDGRTNFSELQAQLAAGRQGRLVYYAFDLLWRGGDIRTLPQIERKQRLIDLLGENDIEMPVLYSEHLTGDGQEMFKHAAKLNWEGIVSKRADAPYRSERNESWLKIKTTQREKFPVVGFVQDPTGVAALYLGKQQGKELVYIGKVGTGWSRAVSSEIRKQLGGVVSPKSMLTKPIRKPKATWVEPKFFADVEYRDIMSEGLLRASSFRGLLGTGLGERAVRPFLQRRCLHRVLLIAEYAL